MRSSYLSKTCTILTCMAVLSFGTSGAYGIGSEDLWDENQTGSQGLLSFPATPEFARAHAEVLLEEWEADPKNLMALRVATILYDFAIKMWTGEERAEVLFEAASTSFKLWEVDPSEQVLNNTIQLFAQALETYGDQISGYQLQMAAGFHLRVFKKEQTKIEHLRIGTHLMLKGINVLGADTSPASLLIGAIYHFRLWKSDRTQADVFDTTMDLYNRAVRAFGGNPPPKLIILKQRIKDASGCNL